MDESQISRKVVESYERFRGRKFAFLDDVDANLLGLDQQKNCLLITGKRKISAWWLLKRQTGYNQNGIGLDTALRDASEISIGETVIIEKATPVEGQRATIKPIEEIIPGISARVAEYIPFALKDDVLTIGEWMWYSFDNTTFVFEVLDIRPAEARAIIVTKDTKFIIEPPTNS